jgi:hypothetical protein
MFKFEHLPKKFEYSSKNKLINKLFFSFFFILRFFYSYSITLIGYIYI